MSEFSPHENYPGPLDPQDYAERDPYGDRSGGTPNPYAGMPGAFGPDVSHQLDELFEQPPVDPNTLLDVDPRTLEISQESSGRATLDSYGLKDWLRGRMAQATAKPAHERTLEDLIYLPENWAKSQAAEAAFSPPSDPEYTAHKREIRLRELRQQAAVRTAARAELAAAGIIDPLVERQEHTAREKANERPRSERTKGSRRNSRHSN